MNQIWALECRLANCEYKIDIDTIQVCPDLDQHLIYIKSVFDNFLPAQKIHNINVPVRNQTNESNNSNRCVSICMADLVQFYNDLNVEEHGIISETSIWDQRTKNDNIDGMYIFDAIRIVQTIGCTTEDGYKKYLNWISNITDDVNNNNNNSNSENYRGNNNENNNTTNDSKENNSCNTIDIIYETPIIDMPDISTYYMREECGPIFTSYGLKIALTFLGPCILKLPCYRHIGKFYNCRNLNLPNIGKVYYHTVLVVGFKETGFIIRNSWGTNWGKNGYGKITEYEFSKYQQFCGYFLSKSRLKNLLIG